MAIKVSGNTVISDGRNVVAGTFDATNISANGASLTGVDPATQIIPPTNLLPLDDAVDLSLTPTLRISEFEGVFNNTLANTQFQVSIDSGFSNTEVDVFTGANTTLTVPADLELSTKHFFRARYFDNNGCCSCFSKPTSFTTGGVFGAGCLGGSVCGGFYMGTIFADSSCYYLIVSPLSGGSAACSWGNSLTNADDNCDGYGNTYDNLANNTFPAGNWVATRTINGFSDWYLPAISELQFVYSNKNCMPAGEGFPTSTWPSYWSSTEFNDSSSAYLTYFNNGITLTASKNCTRRIRVIRREAF